MKHACRLPAISVLAVAAVLALAAPAAAAPVPVPSGGMTVLHWGNYFGDSPPSGGHLIRTPASISLPAPVQQLSTSNSTQYALLTNGQVWAWGLGDNGELGNGTDADSPTTAVQVDFPPGVTIAFLPYDAQPYDSALAVDTTGQAWAWGMNKQGEFCNGTATGSDVPVPVPLPGPVTALAGADSHAIYDADGTVYSCGVNFYGSTGLGTTKGQQDTPAQVPGLPSGVAVDAVTASFANEGALLSNGQFWDWGENLAGQDGLGTAGKPVTTPHLVKLPGPVAQVYQGGSLASNGQTLVMLSSGALYAWGSGTYGQLGTGSTANADSPVPFSPPAGVSYATLATGGGTSYAIDTQGNVWAWGWNSNGQVGNGSTKKSVTVPAEVVTGAGMLSATANDVVAGPPT